MPVWVKLRCCWKNGQCGVGGQPGRDRSGASVAVFVAHLHRPADTTHRAVLKNLIYQLDAALERYAIWIPIWHIYLYGIYGIYAI